MKYALALVATLALSGPAAAQHAHGNKGPNGGHLEDVAGVHAELLTSGITITVNVFDEDNIPVATKGFAASAVVVRGAEREAVALAPALPSARSLPREKAGCRSGHHGYAENGCREIRAGQIQTLDRSMRTLRGAPMRRCDSGGEDALIHHPLI